MTTPPKAKRKTRGELNAEIARLREAIKVARVERQSDADRACEAEGARRRAAEATMREAQEDAKRARAEHADLKARLATAELENQRMRGYISRVQEDDVVREELVKTGDPDGALQLVPKRKPTVFDEPYPYMVAGSSADRTPGYTDYRERDRPAPKHWVTY